MKYDLVNSLIDKATERMTDVDQGRTNIPNFRRHYYTELVARECAEVAWDEVQYEMSFELADKVKQRILNHFGLE